MIVGIGCDVVEHKTTQALNWLSDESVLDRIFSRKEKILFLSHKNDRFLSGRFAAKEAVLKSFGTGMIDGLPLNNIEVLQTDGGKPYIVLSEEAKEISSRLNINVIHISISHSTNYSIAVVIAET